MTVNGQKYEVAYLPGDSDSGLFGGNSNWRGPIWCAVNFLLIESCYRFYTFYGNDFQVECPTGSGNYMHLGKVAENIQHRLITMFLRDEEGRRPINSGYELLDFDPDWKDNVWFFEFFDGDSGRGLGASHQCGWTGLIAKMIHDTGVNCNVPQTPRTPSVAAAHYFDDILTRTKTGLDIRRLRRSSTRRSIGGWSHATSEAGDVDDEDDSPEAQRARSLKRANSVGVWDDEAIKEKQELSQHVSHYVNGQLAKLQDDSALVDDLGDEIEAQGADEDDDYFQIRR